MTSEGGNTGVDFVVGAAAESAYRLVLVQGRIPLEAFNSRVGLPPTARVRSTVVCRTEMREQDIPYSCIVH